MIIKFTFVKCARAILFPSKFFLVGSLADRLTIPLWHVHRAIVSQSEKWYTQETAYFSVLPEDDEKSEMVRVVSGENEEEQKVSLRNPKTWGIPFHFKRITTMLRLLFLRGRQQIFHEPDCQYAWIFQAIELIHSDGRCRKLHGADSITRYPLCKGDIP